MKLYEVTLYVVVPIREVKGDSLCEALDNASQILGDALRGDWGMGTVVVDGAKVWKVAEEAKGES